MKRTVPIILALMFAVCVRATHAQSARPRKDIPAIAKAAKEAIVTIIMANNDDPVAQGTGFLVSPDGVIVTNYHVIGTGNIAIVKFSDGTALPVDGVVAADKVHDVAIIKIHGKNFRTLTLGNSDRIQIGEEVVAIGNPLGLELTVSNGILSGVRTDETEGGKLQITAPISHGSSGGPLFNMAGEVVGITEGFLEGGENLNFAVPINEAKHFLLDRSAKLQNLPNEQPKESPTTTTGGNGKQAELKDTLNWMQNSLSDGGVVKFYNGQEDVVESTELVEFSGCKVHFREDSDHIVFNLGDIDYYRIWAGKWRSSDIYEVIVETRNDEKKISDTLIGPNRVWAFLLKADYAPRFTTAFQHSVEICGGKSSIF